MPFVVPPVSPALEALELDGLPLNSPELLLLEVSCPPPRQRQEWIGAADSEWQSLIRNPLHENRQITVRLQVSPAGNMDGALQQIAEVVDKLQAASRTDDGVELVWQPAGSTIPVTFDVLAGQVTDVPVDLENGWFAKAPTFTVVMDAKPYWRGVETLTTTTTSSTPVTTSEIVNGIGDIPALGRLIVTDTAGQPRRHAEWGLEGPTTYNPATPLLIAPDDLVTSGFAGAAATVSGAYDPNGSGTNAVSASVFTTATAVAGTGPQSHVGAFVVLARVQAGLVSGVTTSVRLTWKSGDGPWTSNRWIQGAQGNAWYEVNLGTIILPTVTSGTQAWWGRIEGISDTVSGTVSVNYLELIPVSAGHGKARASTAAPAGVIVSQDGFNGTVAGTALNGRTAPAGGTWATAGATTDFVAADAPSTNETETRATTADASPRLATINAAVTDMDVAVNVHTTSRVQSLEMGALARYVDTSNHLRAGVKVLVQGTSFVLQAATVIAGVETQLASVPVKILQNVWYVVRIVVYASGTATVSLEAPSPGFSGSSRIAYKTFYSSALAAGGTLASGKPGFFDKNPSGNAASRYYQGYYSATPMPEPIVIYSGRNIEFRHDTTTRQDSTGTYTGPPQSYMPAGRFLVPVGTSRVLAKARRNDVDVASDGSVTDSTQIQVAVTPRGLAVPRG